MTPGRHTLGSKIAIFLIYPKWALKPSHLRSISYLEEKGFSVVVVSNLALSRFDIDLLLPKTACIIERPNIGYDFGGYQDAIRHIAGSRGTLDQLVLLNDSTWFPMASSRDWIDSVSLLRVDFAGAASNLGLAPVAPNDFQSFSWSYATDRPHFHYCSYALSFGENVLRDDTFWAFWDRLQITNDKIQTVRRGEVGLSQLLISRGHSHGSMLAMDDIGNQIETISDDRLLELVRALIIPQEPELSAARTAFLSKSQTSADWRTDAVKFILNAIARTGISYALPEYTTRELGFPFLKKSPLVLDSEGRQETLRIIRNQPATLAVELLAEAEQIMGAKGQNESSLIAQVAV